MKTTKVIYFQVAVALKGGLPRAYGIVEEARRLLESGEERLQKAGWCLIRGPFKRVRQSKIKTKIKGEQGDTELLAGGRWKVV